jgi:PHD/YefM family antitoxin component YafN of YafNO toxin-antitoxin module
VLNQVQTRREPIIIRTYDTPQAVIVPYDDFEEYQAWRAYIQQKTAWLDELQAIAEEVSARANLTDEDAQALVTEAVQETRSA